MREQEQRPADEPDYYREGAQLTAFISLAYFQLRTGVEGTDPYQDYVEWVLGRIIGRRLYIEPPLLEASANVIKHTITSLKKESLTDSPEDVVNSVLRRYILTLPDILRSEIETDLTFLEQIGAELTPIITIGELHFARDEFWQAVATVVNGGEQRISATNIDAMVRFSPLEEQGQVIVCIDHPQRDERVGLNNPEFRILSSSKSEQENFLKSQRHTLDCSDAEFQRIVSELLGIEDSTERVLKLLSIWKDSAAITYRDLARDLQPGVQLDLPNLTHLNFDSLRRYLRLVDSVTNAETYDFDEGTAQLIQELGVEVAFFRISGLPCPLPQVMIDALDSMPSSERVAFLTRRLRTARSLVSTIHLIRLLYRYNADAPTFREAADKILNELLSEEGKQDAEAFIALLLWVHQQFLLRTEFAQYPTQVKTTLTWTHTQHLFSMMKAANINFEWMREFFTSEASRMSVEILLLDKEYRNDIAHPRFANYERIILAGMSYALDSDYANLAPEVTQRVADLAFPILQNGVRYPAIFMFFGAGFLGNAAGTFLNRNIREEVASLSSWERPERFSHEGIAEWAEELIQQILTGYEQIGIDLWAILSAIVRDIQLPEELAEHLSKALSNINWVSLFTENYQLWRIVFYIAIAQYPLSRNEPLKQQLRSAIQKTVMKCAEQDQNSGGLSESDLLETVILLLEGAIRTAVDASSGKIILEPFANTVVDIAWRWKRSRPICTRMIRIMCEDLPLPFAQQLWATFAILRAM